MSLRRETKEEILIKSINYISPQRGFNYVDYTGMTFGHIFVIREVIPFERYNGTAQFLIRYLCKCLNCGTEFIANKFTITKFKNDLNFNCGCLTDPIHYFPIHIGDRFGKLIIIREIDNYMPGSGKRLDLFRCKCDCGREVNLSSHWISRGADSCGYCEENIGKANNFVDLTGQTFGKLYVEHIGPKYYEADGSPRITYWCRCSCGNPEPILTKGIYLTTGDCTSCGCNHDISIKNLGISMNKHGLSNNRIYNTYKNMIDRCYNTDCKEYQYYGARGIKVCDEWIIKENYQGLLNFYNWAINNGYDDNLTIDRINPNDNYKPSNCRWVPKYLQTNNQNTNTFIEFNGDNYTVAQWSRARGINAATIRNRIRNGKDPIESINTPVKGELINAIYFVDKWNNPIGNSIDNEGEING